AETRGIGIKPVKNRPALPIRTGTFRALIIGNNDYHRTGGVWPKLKTAVTDARALKEVLVDRYHFSDVKLLENATRREVLLAL
ncbi:MAG: caspase family protein, partial [Gammaproteobacteria bacterium]|nr:caspase family protein [Gammaproteobacteria bacterium]NIR96353.1 caspase family protein [Gammaproteobacteria bacterium]